VARRGVAELLASHRSVMAGVGGCLG